METTQNILLNSSNNKKEVNENTSLNVALSGNRILLPEDAISDALDSYNVYLEERKNSSKFRLVVNINPYCSNVLFNPFTEIVKDEGSPDVICLNYEKNYTNENVIGKQKSFVWNQYEAIRDTQLSNETCGLEYHCGIDIFNNHILRNKTLKAVNFNENTSYTSIGKLDKAYLNNYVKVKVNEQAAEHVYIDKNFNTIDDYMRDKDGWIISEHFPKIVEKKNVKQNLETIILPLHLYQNYDIWSFRDCIREKLLDDNGWYGFSNPSTLGVTTLKEQGQNVMELLDINKTINYKEYCDFVDLYPTRDLFSFSPKYNKFRKRIEKNWNYCITYPSKSVIKDNDKNFPFFRIDSSGNTSLKVYMIDEGTVDDDESELVTIYTICKHGLVEGDMVNVYKSNTIFYDSAEVVHVIDNYIFQIYKKEGNMSEHWIEVEDRNVSNITLENPYKILNNDGTETSPTPQRIIGGVLRAGDNYYPICESNRCNVDPNAQDIHIRRVVNGVECKYYVRKFSRLPNFKYRDEEVNDFTLYDDDQNKNHQQKRRIDDPKLTLIDRFSKPGDETCEFESQIGKLGFANTSYGDDTTEIVFTDDIDTSYIRDNLGRPLSDIFLTIVKNNKGYQKWYGVGEPIEIRSIDVEYSHCFGKVNSSFLFSDYYREWYNHASAPTELYDVRDIIAASTQKKSLNTETYNVSKKDKDEIEFDRDWEYYGDIVCYSPVDCDEQIIQTAMHRFNTVQRELKSLNAESFEKFGSGVMFYDEIRDVENTLPYLKTNNGDPYIPFKNGSENSKPKNEISPSDTNLYHTTKERMVDMLEFKEGYFYQPHYRIPIKTVSRELSTDEAVEYEIVAIENPGSTTSNGRTEFELKTAESNGFLKNDKIVMYKKSINKYYFVTVSNIIDTNRFTCVIADESGNHVSSISGFFDIKNINDYVLIKKSDEVPDYARLINDGSCRYVWREVVANGMEGGEKVYPFTNDAFYVQRQINFFLRRQDPKKENLGYKGGYSGGYTDGYFDFVPDGEDIHNYPNFDPVNETNYESNEIEEC